MHTQRTPRVLIVDDHPDNIELLRMMLLSQQYDILTATNGADALELVQREPPDLLLLDVMMPHLSGYEVVRHIRNEPQLGYIPIILVTAKQALADKIVGLEAGADDFLPKPVQSAELIAKVRALLRLKRVQDELIAERNKNELLYLVGQQLSDTLDVDQVVGETLNLMVNMLGATQGSVLIKDQPTQRWRRILAQPCADLPPTRDASEQVIAHGLAGRALRTRQVQLVTDTRTDDRWLVFDDDEVQTRTALAIPLIHDRTELGVLTLTHTEPHRFDESALSVVMSVAAQVVSALHNARLYTQLKAAEAAREQFVYMLTHDLRGPLTGILGCLHVLNTSVGDAEREFVDLARRACEAQEGLINDILAVYRAESDVLDLIKTPLTPHVLVAPVLDQIAGAAADREVALLLDLPSTPTIVADQPKLTRVLINLINNAIKFTRRGQVTVTVDQLAATNELRFRVQDNGSGIAPDALPHIFERFYQADQSAGRRGSGLGLNFCREVISAHGGRIWAESTVGVGTTMFFTLPMEAIDHE